MCAMAPDGPAALCGEIYIGDVIVGVNGIFRITEFRARDSRSIIQQLLDISLVCCPWSGSLTLLFIIPRQTYRISHEPVPGHDVRSLDAEAMAPFMLVSAPHDAQGTVLHHHLVLCAVFAADDACDS